ncbi:MAG: TonB-dependent receptor plug domain-containing protein [Opitutales bacterium]|nr:TonB-dependent receptor plug domain-containing protein [Opitutales bacterium]
MKKVLPMLLLVTINLSLSVIAQDDSFEDENIYELSPFEVNTSADLGYLSTNTLSGTRLNTSLKLTPSSISVFNMDFIDDIGANNIREALEYSMSFEIDDGSTNGNHEQFGVGGIRARGFERVDGTSVDFFQSESSTDRYNIERISFARGPNAILFGIGNPGGIVNTVTKRARFNDNYGVEFEINNWGGHRASTDINRVVFEDKFAVRVNLLHSESATHRENAWNDADRFHIALTYKPFENTTIRYSYDEADYGRSFQRRWIVRDGVSDWMEAGGNFVNYNDFVRDGSVDWGLVRNRVDEIEGNLSTGDRPTILWTPSGLVGRNFKYASRSTGTGDQWVDFEREGWNRKDGLGGPVNTTDTNEDSVMLIVEQKLFENFYIEGAYRSENFNRQLRSNVNHDDIEPFIDLAQVLPDGSANPNFGHYFLETRPQRNSIHKSFETKRLMASYEWDSGKQWLGRHQVAALWQNEVKFTRFARARLANRTPLDPNRNRVGQNRLYTRTYINSYRNDGPNGMAVDLVANPIAPFTLTDPVTGDDIGTITPEFIWDRNRPNKAETTSLMLGGQSFFWDDKIALVYGVRQDDLESFGFVETRGQAGQLPDEVTLGELQEEANEFDGETKSIGIALTPFEWLTLTANKSDNFQPQTEFTVFNELAGNKTATGEDYSIRLNLWDGKLYASLNFYETVVDNDTNNSFWFWTRVNPIWETLEAANLVTNPPYVIENGVTVKSTTGEGTEFELVANPTKNITLRFNMSDRDVAVSDVNPHATRYLDQHVSTWSQYRDLQLLDDENETVGSMLDEVVEQNNNRRQEIGGREGNTIERRMNFFGKYTFDDDSFFGGFDVGLGAKFYGDRYLGIQDGADVYFEDYSVWQLKVGYKRPVSLFGNEVDMKLSLNISNLFDNDLVIVTGWGSNDVGGPIARNITTLDARTTTLRATFSF